ncbi:MAG TPA: hypothetical protein PLO44_02900 [Candidatus Paceibacterota bacterium]|nr:hypothetical protein [Candidatus Paceibacterota bacterium]
MKKFFVILLVALFCANFVSAQVMINERSVGRRGQLKIKFKAADREFFTLHATVQDGAIDQYEFVWTNDADSVIGETEEINIPLNKNFKYYHVNVLITRKDMFFIENVEITLERED